LEKSGLDIYKIP